MLYSIAEEEIAVNDMDMKTGVEGVEAGSNKPRGGLSKHSQGRLPPRDPKETKALEEARAKKRQRDAEAAAFKKEPADTITIPLSH